MQEVSGSIPLTSTRFKSLEQITVQGFLHGLTAESRLWAGSGHTAVVPVLTDATCLGL